MERPIAIVLAGSVGAVLTVVFVWCLMVEWGLIGAAYGFLLGNMAGAVGRWVAFLAVVPRRGLKPDLEADPLAIDPVFDPAPVRRMFQQLSQGPDDRGWAIAPLAEGTQAIVYAVRLQDRQPIWRTYDTLAIKFYRPEAALNVEMVIAQFESLFRLHAAFDSPTLNGWKISIPKPLCICRAPLALMMTAVPGRNLNLCLETGDNVTPEVLDSVSRAVVAAMETYWSGGQLHGDLALQNILCDVLARDLSFVDAGTPESCIVCNDITKRWHPAVYDLAHILADVGLDVNSGLRNPSARLRKEIFIASVLRAFLETIGPLEEKKKLLGEIQDCARLHVQAFKSTRWLWRALRKQIGIHRIGAILGRVKAEVDPFYPAN
jgi:tRNA A-37 threonylcarbamoyl transferase component Bud32